MKRTKPARLKPKIYKAKHLKKSADKIAKAHDRVASVDIVFLNSLKFKVMLDKITGMKPSEVESYSYCLRQTELDMFCIYLPGNKRKVDITNLLEIIKNRLNDKMARTLYWNWQNYYTDINNTKIFDIIMSNKEVLRSLEQMYDIRLASLKEWIENRNLELEFGKEMVDKGGHTIDEYLRMLQASGIRREGRLAKRCLEVFPIICHEKEYIRMKDDALVELLYKLPVNMNKLLLLNLLTRLSDAQLCDFMNVADFYFKLSGEYGSKEYSAYFSRIHPQLERKYHTWQNRLQIHKGISRKEIKEFWMEYADFGNIYYFESKKILEMNFFNFIVLEMPESDKTYWISENYYNKYIRRSLISIDVPSEHIGQCLEEDKKYLKYREHKGDWKFRYKRIMKAMLKVKIRKIYV